MNKDQKDKVPAVVEKLGTFDNPVVKVGEAVIDGQSVVVKRYPSVKENPQFHRDRMDLRERGGMRLSHH